MLRNILVILGLLVAGILAYASTLPDSFRVERHITINAPPEAIFPLINDFRRWDAWSPWEKRDPDMRRSYAGASGGVGAVYEWDGNSEVGAGRMEIIQSVAASKVVIDLQFRKPFAARNTAEFILAPRDGTTSVTWSMSGPLPFLSKLLSVFMSMDAMIGGDFENGLAALKSRVERPG